MAHGLADVVVTGADTRQTGLTSRRRGRAYPPSGQCSVERGASRDARHVRGRLSKVIPPYWRSNLRILSHDEQRMRASGTRRGLQRLRSVLSQAGAPCPKLHGQSPGGKRTTAARPIGCKARQVRLTHAGVGSFPVATPRNRGPTTSGVLPRKADREQLNDERGLKPLPVNDRRDASRSGKARPGWVRGRFCILSPEIGPQAGPETVPGREPRTCLASEDAYASSPRDCGRAGQE